MREVVDRADGGGSGRRRLLGDEPDRKRISLSPKEHSPLVVGVDVGFLVVHRIERITVGALLLEVGGANAVGAMSMKDAVDSMSVKEAAKYPEQRGLAKKRSHYLRWSIVSLAYSLKYTSIIVARSDQGLFRLPELRHWCVRSRIDHRGHDRTLCPPCQGKRHQCRHCSACRTRTKTEGVSLDYP